MPSFIRVNNKSINIDSINYYEVIGSSLHVTVNGEKILFGFDNSENLREVTSKLDKFLI